MSDIWTVLIPILVVDAVNPVLLALMVYAAGTERPIISSSAVLLGHTLAYFGAGLVIALWLEQITQRFANPQRIDFVVGLVVGLFLLWVAFRPANKAAAQKPQASGTLTPFKALGLGAVINFVGIPFALPYFAALDQILKANLDLVDSLTVLVVYNLLYALPFVAIPLLAAALGSQSQALLQKINDVVDRISRYLMPVLLGLAGVALVSDAIYYFATGQGLF